MNKKLTTCMTVLLASAAVSCSTTKKSESSQTDSGPHVPKVIMPNAKCETVKEKFEGKRWEEAHRVCTLKDAVWSPE